MFATIWKHTSTPRLWFTTGLIAAMLGIALGTALRGEATTIGALSLAAMDLMFAILSISLLHREAQLEEARVRRTVDLITIEMSERFCAEQASAAEDEPHRCYWHGARVATNAVGETLREKS